MATNNNNSNCVCNTSPSDLATRPGVGKSDEDFKQIWEEFHRLRLDGELPSLFELTKSSDLT